MNGVLRATSLQGGCRCSVANPADDAGADTSNLISDKRGVERESTIEMENVGYSFGGQRYAESIGFERDVRQIMALL